MSEWPALWTSEQHRTRDLERVRRRIEQDIQISMSGHVAESLSYGFGIPQRTGSSMLPRWHSAVDDEHVRYFAWQLWDREIDSPACEQWLDDLYYQSAKLVCDGWDDITAVAEALLARGRLTATEVTEILDSHDLRETE